MTFYLVFGAVSTAFGDFIVIALSFLLLLFLLSRFAWKPLNQVLSERQKQITDSMDKAEKAQQQAKQTQADADKQLAAAHKKANAIVAQAESESEQLQADAVSKAQDEADKITKQAQAEASARTEQTQRSLEKEVGRLAVDIAGKILQREVKQTDQEALIEKFIEGLEKHDGKS